MKIRNLLLAGLVTILAWSCSEDALQGGGTTTPETASKKYMEVSIKMPATTRTNTHEGMDTEEGTTAESTVKEVLIVMTKATTQDESNFVEGELCFVKSVKVVTSGMPTEGVHIGGDKITARLNNITLPTEKNNWYMVYAFVNPVEGMVAKYQDAIGENWENLYEQAAEDETDVDGFITKYANVNDLRFMMTDTDANAELSQHSKKTAKRFEEQTLTEGAGVFKLSAEVKVERAVARFDYRVAKENNIYYYPENTTSGDADLQIQLVGYKLMNVSKSFYHLRRVTTAVNNGTITIGGLEKKDNYVMDWDWNDKKTWYNNSDKENELADRKKMFFTPLNPDTKSIEYKELPTDQGGSPQTKLKDNFMTYCTENTIPGIDEQVNGISTAMVFKARVTGKLIDNAEEGITALYEYSGVVYNQWETFKNAWNNDHQDIEKQLSGNNEPADLTEVKKLLFGQAKRIPIKGEPGDRYSELYYIYRNRHNDNNNNKLMGIMEFAVVRNNIYKLKVASIKELGHPNDPTDPTTDPEPEVDPPTPDLPDEDSKAYMDVEVEILNWTVRENEIVFD